jgi:hypothetical protein
LLVQLPYPQLPFVNELISILQSQHFQVTTGVTLPTLILQQLLHLLVFDFLYLVQVSSVTHTTFTFLGFQPRTIPFHWCLDRHLFVDYLY